MRSDTPPLLLRIEALSRRFGALRALEDVTFTVRRGEVLGLIGPNGAGKTTLLECIAGLQPPDGGRLEVDAGRPLRPADRPALLYYVPDGIRPWPDQRVAWALDFTLGLFGGDASRREEVVASLGLRDLLRTRIGVLSKGQLKRVVLALGLLVPHPLLLCDEPFDGLDLRQTREVAAVLREQSRRGRTLLLSIHQIGDAARVCDRFVLLSGGRVRGEGALEELAALAAGMAGAAAGQDLEEVFLALT
jgi:ABC-type multidrug transport system ATPase subunit